MNKAYLSLGSNEGDREEWLKKALWLLSVHAGSIEAISSVYETAAWGLTDQPDFLNLVLLLETALAPEALLASILNTETILGRQRTIKWGPRTLDIDILFFNNEVIDKPRLIVPHPFLQERRFILMPMAEIAPDLMHPGLHKTISQLLAECPDASEVKIR